MFPVAFALMVSACVPGEAQLAKSSASGPGAECGPASGTPCFFRNAPLRLAQDEPRRLPGRPYTFFPTAEQLDFVDGGKRIWTAPRRTLTDGASIPPLFVPLVGEPNSPEFATAAAMHDAYCGVGNDDLPTYRAQTWQDVHRMFHDTLVVSGTPEIKAKLMFAAVWLGGPRWHPISKADNRALAAVPAPVAFAAMAATKAYIERNNPSIDDLVAFMRNRERMMLHQARAGGPDLEEDHGSIQSPISPGFGDGFTSP